MIYCSSRLLVCQLALLFLVETTAVPRSLAAPLNPLSPGVLKSNTTYEGAYVSTHPNLVHADAPDKEVSEFTGGKYKSCTEVKAASLCHKSAAKRGCAVTCAALDMKRVQALVQTQSSKCKAYPGKKKAYVPFIKPSEFTEADNEARYELEEKAEAEVVTESALKTAEEEIQPAEETKDAAWNLQDRLWGEKTEKWNTYHGIAKWKIVSRNVARNAAQKLENEFNQAHAAWQSMEAELQSKRDVLETRQREHAVAQTANREAQEYALADRIERQQTGFCAVGEYKLLGKLTGDGSPGLIGQKYNGNSGDDHDWFANNVALKSGGASTSSKVFKEDEGDHYSYSWTGAFIPHVSGTWKFWTSSDDGSHVWIEDLETGSSDHVVNNGGQHGTEERYGTKDVVKDKVYLIQITFDEYGGGAYMRFDYEAPGHNRVQGDWHDSLLAHGNVFMTSYAKSSTTPSPGGLAGNEWCAVCPEGTFNDECSTTTHQCSPCPIGSYNDLTGRRTCSVCGTSKTTDNLGSLTMSDCNYCPYGKVTTRYSGGECFDCKDGYTYKGSQLHGQCVDKFHNAWWPPE